jgi:hypothetical protein
VKPQFCNNNKHFFFLSRDQRRVARFYCNNNKHFFFLSRDESRVARFFSAMRTKIGIYKKSELTNKYIYQMAINYSKCPENGPNGHNLYYWKTVKNYPKWDF